MAVLEGKTLSMDERIAKKMLAVFPGVKSNEFFENRKKCLKAIEGGLDLLRQAVKSGADCRIVFGSIGGLIDMSFSLGYLLLEENMEYKRAADTIAWIESGSLGN